MSSIFISHSSHDNAWAERIRDWLKDEQKQRPQEQRFRSLFLDFDPTMAFRPASAGGISSMSTWSCARR